MNEEFDITVSAIVKGEEEIFSLLKYPDSYATHKDEEEQ